jgi:hypothetical protein
MTRREPYHAYKGEEQTIPFKTTPPRRLRRVRPAAAQTEYFSKTARAVSEVVDVDYRL